MKAAIYLRSSKDRNDVSIDAQRRELYALAKNKNLTIVKEYCDKVESAKSINRPEFLKLIQSIKDKGRGWDNLLFIDTSRLSRRRFAAQAFKRECSKQGVTIIYSKMPDLDPITQVIVESVFEAMDEVHSLMSKEKGLAGMAENIRQGFRAGGRAPYGYQLKYIETGAIREGKAVTKSTLEPSEHAPMVRRYLKARAKGMPRTLAAEKSKITKAKTTLIGMEWNALTYSGSTVWNVHNEMTESGYMSGSKRKPRAEWIIRENTHKGLISPDEAERILVQLNNSKRSVKTKHVYLLGSLLKTMDNKSWHGDGGKYYALAMGKTKKRINKQKIEQAVLNKIGKDLVSKKMVKSILDNARKSASTIAADQTPLLTKRHDKLKAKIARMMNLAADMNDAAPALRQIEAMEEERAQIELDLITETQRIQSSQVLKTISESDVTKLLGDLYHGLKDETPDNIKAFLFELIDSIQLEPNSKNVIINYKFGVKVASPREHDPSPILYIKRAIKI